MVKTVTCGPQGGVGGVRRFGGWAFCWGVREAMPGVRTSTTHASTSRCVQYVHTRGYKANVCLTEKVHVPSQGLSCHSTF
jgi:hypothetical protein